MSSPAAFRRSAPRVVAIHLRIAHVAGMYFGGIAAAGLFTLVPRRVMGAMIFDGAPGLASGLVAGAVSVLLVAAGALAVREAGWAGRFSAVFRRR